MYNILKQGNSFTFQFKFIDSRKVLYVISITIVVKGFLDVALKECFKDSLKKYVQLVPTEPLNRRILIDNDKYKLKVGGEVIITYIKVDISYVTSNISHSITEIELSGLKSKKLL
jgi:hypothetical protein